MEDFKREIHSKKEKRGSHEGFKEVLRVRVDDNHDVTIYRKDRELLRIFLEDVRTNTNVFEFVDFVQADLLQEIRIIEKTYFNANISSFVVTVSLEELKNPRNVFLLLHELGHLRAAPHWKKWAEDNPEDAESLVRYRRYGGEGVLDDAEEIRGAKTELREERDAWSEAIHIARSIRERYGVNLFELFPEKGEFMGWMRVESLRTYEAEVEERGEGAYTHKEKVNEWLRHEWEEEVLHSLRSSVEEVTPQKD